MIIPKNIVFGMLLVLALDGEPTTWISELYKESSLIKLSIKELIGLGLIGRQRMLVG